MENENNIDKLPEVRGEYRLSEPMCKYTRLNVGGPVDVMFFPQDEDDLRHFLRHRSDDMPVFILGGGSNLLVRDGGVSGVVIKLKNPNFSRCETKGEYIYAGAGMRNGELKKVMLSEQLGGLEFICSIPGCLGGLLRTNAGCFGSDISKVLHSARVMTADGEVKQVKNSDFHFGYRRSDFPEDWIVLELCLKGEKSSAEKISKILEHNSAYRVQHQPMNVRTAGSTFKNPEGYQAWRLIKSVGGCDMKVGGAHFSPLHCNFLVNDGSATAEDIENLGEQIREKIKQQTGVNMEWEVKIIGKRKK